MRIYPLQVKMHIQVITNYCILYNKRRLSVTNVHQQGRDSVYYGMSIKWNLCNYRNNWESYYVLIWKYLQDFLWSEKGKMHNIWILCFFCEKRYGEKILFFFFIFTIPGKYLINSCRKLSTSVRDKWAEE